MAYNGTFAIAGDGVQTAATTGASASTDTARIGASNGLQAISITTSDTATPGYSSGVITGDSSKQYAAAITIGATSYATDLDLTALTNGLGSQNFSEIHLLHVAISSPDGTKSVRVGPMNQTNAWSAPFGAGTNATDYLKVTEFLTISNFITGWTVDGTHKVIRIYNPGASSVTVHVWIVGK